MAILKAKDVAKMDLKARAEKLKELKMEFVKAHVTANKSGAKTKEIKRAIARILTFNATDAKAQKAVEQK